MFNQTTQSRNQRCNTAVSVGLNSGSKSQDSCSGSIYSINVHVNWHVKGKDCFLVGFGDEIVCLPHIASAQI
jgi:hypothetical protein